MLTLQSLRDLDPRPSRAAVQVAWGTWRALQTLFGVRMELEGEDALPQGPCLFACNGSHWYDPLPYRAAFHQLGRSVVSVGKGKLWHVPHYRPLLAWLGALPLASRGYLLVADFQAVHGRLPSDAQYRALRDHLDGGPQPTRDVDLCRLLREPRDLCGAAFDPARQSYRDALLERYRALQALALAGARRAVKAGCSLQIYPAGTVSLRLSRGHVGAVQLAHALALPLVPVGMSGAAEVFPNPSSPRLRRGVLTLRFGPPCPAPALPTGFAAFDPDAEVRHAPALREATDALMERINALLDPPYRWAPARCSDGRQGVARFL